MSDKIEWFKNGPDESNLEYIGIKSNIVIARVKREKEYNNYWVARDIYGEVIENNQYRSDLFEWVEMNKKD